MVRTVTLDGAYRTMEIAEYGPETHSDGSYTHSFQEDGIGMRARGKELRLDKALNRIDLWVDHFIVADISFDSEHEMRAAAVKLSREFDNFTLEE